MAKTREIKKRIKAVGNIRRITKTMQLIAAAKFSASQQRALATKPYTEGIFDLVKELAATGSNLSHPLIVGPAKTKTGAKELTLVITSDRGLCGPYNSSILRTAMVHLRETPAADGGFIEVAGKKGVNFLKFNKVAMAQQHNVGDKPTFAQIEAIAQSFIERFTKGEVSAVRVIFMKYLSAGRQRPEIMQLLPVKPPAKAVEPGAKAARGVDYEFSPDQDELLNDLIPAAVKAMLYQAFNDAIVSEHVARMVAMKSATDAAGKMSKRLTRQFNRARQAQITTELTEIISGAAALS